MMSMLKIERLVLAVLMLALLGGCATASRKDPIEPFNRAVFEVNDAFDNAVLQPVAKGYVAVLPTPVRGGVSNFFSNIGDVWIAVNNLLQGKVGDAASDVGRVAVNTTIGILGVVDVASKMGLEKHDEDFGQTLGRWGVGDGAYVVLPLFGSRTARDTAGLAVDSYVDPVGNISHVRTRNVISGVRLIDNRANLLDVGNLLDDAALDRYTFVRDAYIQRRHNLIYDGNPPRESAADEEEDAAKK